MLLHMLCGCVQLLLLRLLVCIRDAKAYPKMLASTVGAVVVVGGSLLCGGKGSSHELLLLLLLLLLEQLREVLFF